MRENAVKKWRAKGKRLAGLLLAVCMVLTGIPMYAQNVQAESTDLLAHYDFMDLSGSVAAGSRISDLSGNENHAQAKGSSLSASEGVLTFPGGNSDSGAGYVELPKGMFDGQDTLSISMWMKNETGANNYAGFYFGTPANSQNGNFPTQYFILNPMNPKGVMKAVMTNAYDASSPFNTEVGVGSTGNPTDGPATGNSWALYTVVITKDSITGYLNGVKYKTYKMSTSVSDFGTDLLSYIGKSPYADMFYKGGVKDLCIYTKTLSEAEIVDLYCAGAEDDTILNQAEQALTIPEAGNGTVNRSFVEKLTLADSLLGGNVKVAWKSNNTAVIGEDGTVYNPSETTQVRLTASLTRNSKTQTKDFTITVVPEEETTYSMTVDPSKEGAKISQELVGLFFEDINSAADGGLYPEMVKNYSFENYFNVVSVQEPGRGNQYSWKLHWVSDKDSNFVVEQADGLNDRNTNYAKITGNMVLKNGGFAPMSAPNSAAMPMKENNSFDFSIWTKADSSYSGTLKVKVVNEAGKDLTDEQEITLINDGTWQKATATLTANRTAKGKLVLNFSQAEDTDVLYMDMVSLSPQDTYGYGNQNYACGKGLRKDLVEKLQGLNPSFIRFPGGCIIEGNSGRESYYNWENSIGTLEERKAVGNLWASDNGSYTNTYGYMQSYGFGYHEILTLCEDLGAEPFPILSAGVFCQFANGDNAPAASGAELDKFAQHATHLIDYCWGSVLSTDATQREWAKKRVDNGHEQPFNLNYVGIGNENWEAKYLNNFDYIKDYVETHVAANYPGRSITIISSAGPAAEDYKYQDAWDWFNEKDTGETLVDEHYYQSKEFMLNNDDRYDYYTRLEDGGSNVFLGEYATHLGSRNNNLESAICDAAYMTGIERNGDIVRHASYAPLFEKIGGTNWSQNMIHFDEYESFATPNYYTQQMFAQNYGTQVVDTALEKKGVNYTQNTGSPIIGTWATAGYVTRVKVTRADGKVLLDDDFSKNGDAGMTWAAFPGSTAGYGISGGKLTFAQGSGMNAVWLPDAVNNPEWHDYTVEATVVKTAGKEGFLVGAGAKDGENYYWYNLGGWDNTMNAVQRTRTDRGTTVLGNHFKYGFTPIKTNEEMKVTFNYGVNGKLEAGYVSGSADKSKDFSSSLKPYQNDIYQVCSKDDQYIYLKLVNYDSYAKDITLNYPCSLTSDQAEILCMSGDGNAVNSIGDESVKPVTAYQTIQDQKLKYLVPAMSFTVIKVAYTKDSEVGRVEKITLDKANISLEAGQSAVLKAAVTVTGDADQTVTWSSSAASVAKVENGTVTALRAGTAVITAKAGDQTASCTVTVKEKPVPPVPDDPKPVVKKGDTAAVNGITYRVTSIGAKKTAELYKGKAGAKSISVPKSVRIQGADYKVTGIAAKAFYKNKKLASAKIGENVTSIGSRAFEQCVNLKTVKMGNKVTAVKTGAFKGCTKLTGVTLGKNLKEIGSYAFQNCKKLKKITIPANVTAIRKGAFQKCSQLKQVTVKSKKLKKVEKAAFKGVPAKCKFVYPAGKKTAYKKLFKR